MVSPTLFELLFRKNTFFHEFCRIDVINSGSFAYSLVHHWLSKPKYPQIVRWLILLIVAIATVANNVNKYILFKLLSIFNR